MTRRQMTLDEVEEMWDRYRRGETVAILRQLIERLTADPGAYPLGIPCALGSPYGSWVNPASHNANHRHRLKLELPVVSIS